MWPADPESLIRAQQRLAAATPIGWTPPGRRLTVGACWVAFPRGLTGPGAAGDPAWAAAVAMSGGRIAARTVRTGTAGAAYTPGLLALRAGELMEQTVRALGTLPDVLLLDATARDHPRGAGLALHLGAMADLPTIGITHRPLLATGDWPADRRGAAGPIRIGDIEVGCWLRTREGTRPLVVHPGWRVDLPTAVDVILAAAVRRTPEPLRQARRLARTRRAAQTR